MYNGPDSLNRASYVHCQTSNFIFVYFCFGILYSTMYKLKIWRLEIVIRFTYILMRYLKVVIMKLVIWYGF